MITVDDRQVLTTMGKLLDHADDMSPAFEQIADDWLLVQAENWDTRGGLVGGWQPLSRGTIENRIRTGKGDGGILEYRTAKGGRMRAALTKKGASWQIRDVGTDSLTVGTNLGIAPKHHKGFRALLNGSIPIVIPRRPLIVPLGDLQERWTPILLNHLAGDDRGTGGLRP